MIVLLVSFIACTNALILPDFDAAFFEVDVSWTWSSVAAQKRKLVSPSYPQMLPFQELDIVEKCLPQQSQRGLAALTAEAKWARIVSNLSVIERHFIDLKYADNKALGAMVMRCPTEELYKMVLPYIPATRRRAIEEEKSWQLKLRTLRHSLAPVISSSLNVDRRHDSYINNIQQRERYAGDRVCVSLSVYEEPEWIDSLLKEVLARTEPSTYIMLHLNANTYYSEEILNYFRNYDQRVRLNPERIPVEFATGSVLYSHLSNVRQMADANLGCTYVVMQASNMRWLRNGMEGLVRERKFGGTNLYFETCEIEKNSTHPFLLEIHAPRGLWGIGYHEGSFYPHQHILAMYHAMHEYLERTGQDVSTITKYNTWVEECWLQTYMLNHADLAEQQNFYPSSAFREIVGYGVPPYGVTTEQLDVLLAAKDTNQGEWSKVFGAKRVPRDFNDPVTARIVALTAR
eukprot:TRINITY_DN55367_c0_g1_i1.p1 TRINITY_DN55367_c0_g1~~TRINITY_DN55367_c0_g1_i1.p1  ORF type:complete len:459 (-),score=52.17 TRINITY_DN55367_c0_g1_i1:64-1440(-)